LERVNRDFEIMRMPLSKWAGYRKLRLEAMRSDLLAFLSARDSGTDCEEDFWKERMSRLLFLRLTGGTGLSV